ncbi:nucleotidyl transferase AbiEii/AbiGii toxin family protein [Comamonas endophytica]|uniref:Nucleotidyl transferase AbiEii/AbiGii toxin family protein n=2 Tax=Comamonas endophytica TaxID=2949090 RepID=A0ABY6GFZ2_9BURK|nr:nucleotidyl transferase AbiEii/AbiGii toxin family protein [Acidovorax sp. 5MLIR]UYG53996.1 nucleotidyl transferase AbiEii/AbiGii toxin family protein [Acidovorax sp. 5MLIR]
MKADFQTVIAASDADRLGLFLATAARLGTPVQNVEKDFWVCWTLDALFNGLPAGGPRLLFKGGTSLSKAFGLISRFSEDIDITVFREDLGQPVEAADLDVLTGKKRRAKLDDIRDACQAYITAPFTPQLYELAAQSMSKGFKIEADEDDKDGQTVLFWYPTVTGAESDYIRAAVKIEAGAKSALDPHIPATVTPYVAQDLPDLDLHIGNVTTVKPERTFWDKIMILHGLRQWHENRGVLRHGGQRVSRHYYDIYRLAQAKDIADWQADKALAEDCATHARLFFGSPDLGLDTATAGSFTLSPSEEMRDALIKDYAAMSGMIFGEVPTLDDVLAKVADVEQVLNSTT